MAIKTYKGQKSIGIEDVQAWLNNCSQVEINSLKSRGIERKQQHDVPTLVSVEVVDDEFWVNIDDNDVSEWIEGASDEEISDASLLKEGKEGYEYIVGIKAHENAGNDMDVRAIQDLMDTMHVQDILATLKQPQLA